MSASGPSGPLVLSLTRKNFHGTCLSSLFYPSTLSLPVTSFVTWPLTKTNLHRLQCNVRAMIRQICMVRSNKLLAKLELEDLSLSLRERRLHWFGHMEHSSGSVRTACDIQIDGRQGAGRPKLTWKKLIEKDCREWKLTTVDPQERSTWRSDVRSAMRAASQLPGRGLTDVNDAPSPVC